MARARTPKDDDPNRLKRERAGRYVTADGRFAVEGESTGNWYLVDNERQNELGLPLMAGPFGTLDEARAQVAAIREGRASRAEPDAPESAGLVEPPASTEATEPPARPSLRSLPGGRTGGQHDGPGAPSPELAPEPARAPALELTSGPTTTTGTQPAAPGRGRRVAPRQPDAGSALDAPSGPAWLGRLQSDRQAEARRLLAILDRLGIDDALLARRQVEADLPEISRALLARRIRREALDIWREPGAVSTEVESVANEVRRHLRPLVEPVLDAAGRALVGTGSGDDAASLAWLVALRTVGAVLDVIDSEGDERRVAGEPGWRLVELDGRREPTNRAIALDPSDVLDAPAN